MTTEWRLIQPPVQDVAASHNSAVDTPPPPPPPVHSCGYSPPTHSTVHLTLGACCAVGLSSEPPGLRLMGTNHMLTLTISGGRAGDSVYSD